MKTLFSQLLLVLLVAPTTTWSQSFESSNLRRSSLLILPYSQAVPVRALYLPASQTSKCQALEARLTHFPEVHRQVNLNSREHRKWMVKLNGSRPGGRLRLSVAPCSPDCRHAPLTSIIVEPTALGTAELKCRATGGAWSVRLSQPSIDRRRRLKMKISMTEPPNEYLPVAIWVLATGEVVTKMMKKGTTSRNVRLLQLPPANGSYQLVALSRSSSGEIIAQTSVLEYRGGRVKFFSSAPCESRTLEYVLETNFGTEGDLCRVCSELAATGQKARHTSWHWSMAGLKLLVANDTKDPTPPPGTLTPSVATSTNTRNDVTVSTPPDFPKGEARTDHYVTVRDSQCQKCPQSDLTTSCRHKLGVPRDFLTEQEACLILRRRSTVTVLEAELEMKKEEARRKFDILMAEVVQTMLSYSADLEAEKKHGLNVSHIPVLLEEYLSPGGLIRLPHQEPSISLTSEVVRVLCVNQSKLETLWRRGLQALDDWLHNSTLDSPSLHADDVIDVLVTMAVCKPHSLRKHSERLEEFYERGVLPEESRVKLGFLAQTAGLDVSKRKLLPANLALIYPDLAELPPFSVAGLVCEASLSDEVKVVDAVTATFSLRTLVSLSCPKPQLCACLAERLQRHFLPDASWPERHLVASGLLSYVHWLQGRTWTLPLSLPHLTVQVQLQPRVQVSAANSTPSLPEPDSRNDVIRLSPASPSPRVETFTPSLDCPDLAVSVQSSRSGRRHVTMEIKVCYNASRLNVVLQTFPGSTVLKETAQPQRFLSFDSSHPGYLLYSSNSSDADSQGCVRTLLRFPSSSRHVPHDPPFLKVTSPDLQGSCVRIFHFGNVGRLNLPRICASSSNSPDVTCCCSDVQLPRDMCFHFVNLDDPDEDTSLTFSPRLVNWFHVQPEGSRVENSFRIWNFRVLATTSHNKFNAEVGDTIQYVTSSICNHLDFNVTSSYWLLAPQPLRFCPAEGQRCSYLFHKGTLVRHRGEETAADMRLYDRKFLQRRQNLQAASSEAEASGR